MTNFPEEKKTRQHPFAFRHFYERALERHGLTITKSEVKRIINQIRSSSAEFLRWTDDEFFRSFYRVRIYGKFYIVLYDVPFDSLITIYHNSWLKFKNGEWVMSQFFTQKRLRAHNWKKRRQRED